MRGAAASAGAGGAAGALMDWWRSRTGPAEREMRVVETLPLGPKRSVALLEIAGQRFLAGMGAEGVTTLLQIAPGGNAGDGDGGGFGQ